LNKNRNELPDLMICTYEFNFTVIVQGVLFENNWQKCKIFTVIFVDLVIFSVIFITTIILLLIYLIRTYYLRYKIRKIALDKEL